MGEFIRERAGERADAFVGLSQSTTPARRRSAPRPGSSPTRSPSSGRRRSSSLEAAGDAAAALYSNAEAFERYTAALELTEELPRTPTARESARSRATWRPGSGASTRPWLSGSAALEYHRGEEDLARVADLHRKIGAALWHKGERRASIDNYQRGIDLLKDGAPCIELVRLYEEAASLYMHTGDNMLAIYASEKALRLAERLGEARAASRAHGIFGRVFGRIGDSEKARENLERSVALARESDPAEAVRALLTLGYHLEVSEADYDGARTAYREALELAQEVGDLPSQVELHAALGQLAVEAGDWDEVERATEASSGLVEREGLHGKLCFPRHAARGARLAPWATGRRAAAEFSRAHELGEQVGRSEVAFSALYWLAVTKRETDDLGGAETELSRALDICERAGLIAQSVEAISGRAVVLALAGRTEQARTAAEEAERLPSGSTTRSARPPPPRRPGPARRTRPAPTSSCAARGSAGPRSAGLSTRPGAPSSTGGCWLRGTRPPPPPSSARPPPSMRRWACPGSPAAPASWSPDRGVLAPAGPDRGTGRARLGAARGPGSIPAVERLGPGDRRPDADREGIRVRDQRPRAAASADRPQPSGSRSSRRCARSSSAARPPASTRAGS